jgi:hypothetical protein
MPVTQISHRDLFLIIGGAFGIAGNLVWYVMVGRCNERLPEEKQISYFWGFPGDTLKDIRIYRQLFPNGRLHLVFWWLVGLTGLCFLLMIILE